MKRFLRLERKMLGYKRYKLIQYHTKKSFHFMDKVRIFPEIEKRGGNEPQQSEK